MTLQDFFDKYDADNSHSLQAAEFKAGLAETIGLDDLQIAESVETLRCCRQRAWE